MTLRIKDSTAFGQVTSINVSAFDTIESVKQKIEHFMGYPTCSQRLIFGGKQLEDGRTLADYNIQTNDEIHCCMRIRGS